MEDKNKKTIRDTVANENEQSVVSNEQRFDFITETIKKKPINKKRFFLKFLLTVFWGVLFGAVACVTFLLLQPRLQEHFGVGQKQEEVTLSQREDETEEDGISTEEVDVAQAAEEKPREVVTQVVQKVEKVEKNLDVSDYKQLYTQISRVAVDIKKSLVTVTGIYSDTDWFLNPYEQTASSISSSSTRSTTRLRALSPLTR